MRPFSSLVLLGWLAGVCLCQYQFTNPDPDNDDFSQTFQNDDIINITWVSGWEGVGDSLSNPDLWITSSDTDAFSQLLKASINLSHNGSLLWRANISDAELEQTPRYVFRFKPHTNPTVYSTTQNESPSRGFNLIPNTNPTTSTSASASTATASKTASASHSATTSATAGSSSSLSGGAIAGIAIGGVAVIAFFALGAWFLLRYRKKANATGSAGMPFEKDGDQTARVEAGTSYKPPQYGGTYQPVPPAPVEADGHAMAAELYGEGGQSPQAYGSGPH